MDTALTPRDEKGRILAPLPGGAPPITPANARTLALKRWEKYRKNAVQKVTGIIAEVDPSVSTGAEAYAVILAKHAKLLHDSKQPKIYDVEKLGQLMTGHDGQDSQRGNAGAAPPGTISAAPDTLMTLVDMLEKRRAQDQDKARAVDGQEAGNVPTE